MYNEKGKAEFEEKRVENKGEVREKERKSEYENRVFLFSCV